LHLSATATGKKKKDRDIAQGQRGLVTPDHVFSQAKVLGSRRDPQSPTSSHRFRTLIRVRGCHIMVAIYVR
jgi:hypothetical protein